MRMVRRLALWAVCLTLCWEAYYTGPRDSVLVNGALSLAERIVIASKDLPDLLEQGLFYFNQLVHRAENMAVITSDSLFAETPRSITTLDEEVIYALAIASQRTGVSYAYLANTAHLESNFDVHAKAPTSSASGIFQVIDSTWLRLVHDHGPDYGWGGYARQIDCTVRTCRVRDQKVLSEILDLRFDGQIATYLTAEFARGNQERLEANLGRAVSDYELYLAHFLGVAGATRFFQNLAARPFAIAAETFPAAAKANRNIFYGRLGGARTFRDVDARFQKRWEACKPFVADATPKPILELTQQRDA